MAASSFVARKLQQRMLPFLHVYKNHVARALAAHMQSGWKVLDVGCDDGTTATLIQQLQPGLEFEGVDIQSLRECKIPRSIYDGRELPFADNTFDAVMAVDMLHHTQHIDVLVNEMARVARHTVIIKDHLTKGFISWLLVSAGDAVTNIPFGIPCAYNFPSKSRWHEYFGAAGLEVQSYQDDLELPKGCIRRYNPLFVLRKASAATDNATSTLSIHKFRQKLPRGT